MEDDINAEEKLAPPPPSRDPLPEPLDAIKARNLARHILEYGNVVIRGHVLDEMEKENPPLTNVEVTNAIRAGSYQAPEIQRGTWRYRIHTQRISVVIAFCSEKELRAVTAWRFK